MDAREMSVILQQLDQVKQRLMAIESKIDGLSRPTFSSDRANVDRSSAMLTVGEVAEIMRVNAQTVRRWIDDRKIVFIKLPGGDLRIKKANLDGWIEKRMIK